MVFVKLLIAPSLYINDFFFFNDTATTEIYTLSLHDALPISDCLDLHPYLTISPQHYAVMARFRRLVANPNNRRNHGHPGNTPGQLPNSRNHGCAAATRSLAFGVNWNSGTAAAMNFLARSNVASSCPGKHTAKHET